MQAFSVFLQNKSKKQPNDPNRLFSCCGQRPCQTEGSCFRSRSRRKRHRPLVAEPSLCHKTKVSGKGHFRRSAHPQATVRRLSLLFFRHFRFWHLEKNQSVDCSGSDRSLFCFHDRFDRTIRFKRICALGDRTSDDDVITALLLRKSRRSDALLVVLGIIG